MKFSAHFSVPSRKPQGIGENGIGDEQLTPRMASPLSLFLGNAARTSFRGTAAT
jgi:hypothetical protein